MPSYHTRASADSREETEQLLLRQPDGRSSTRSDYFLLCGAFVLVCAAGACAATFILPSEMASTAVTCPLRDAAVLCRAFRRLLAAGKS